MMIRVKFYKGDYKERQREANAANAALYIEQHFNSCESRKAGYALAIVGSNASKASVDFAEYYVELVQAAFNVPIWSDSLDNDLANDDHDPLDLEGTDGVMRGGRGNGNLKYTAMPAVLLEPLFASNPAHAEFIKSTVGQYVLASVLACSIRRHVSPGRLIAFSVGHKYKASNPNDRGASVYGSALSEADFAENVLNIAADILRA